MNCIELSNRHFEAYNHFMVKAESTLDSYSLYINKANYHLERAKFWTKKWEWKKNKDRHHISCFGDAVITTIYKVL